MPLNELIIIGAGRHALETYFLVNDLEYAPKIIGFVQDEVESGDEIMGKPLISTSGILSNYATSKKPLLLGAIGNITDNKRLIETFKTAGFNFFSAIPKSIIIERQKFIGEGITIASGTILTTNISVGNYSIINIGCNISHDVTIGQYVNISPGANIAGNVNIEDEVFIGSGVTIIPKISIGKGSVIAAGACVIKDVPPYSLAAGVPAIVKKYLK